MATTDPIPSSVHRIGLKDLDDQFKHLRLADPRAVAQLIGSMRVYGQLTPIMVAASDDGRYPIVDGFKRVEAAGKLGWTQIVAAVVKGRGRVLKVTMLQLNSRRQRLSAFEQALIVRSLYRDDQLTQAAIGTLLGHDKSWVSRKIAIVERLHEEVLARVRLGLITPSVARELARLPRGNQVLAMAAICKHRLTYRESVVLVDLLLAAPEGDHEAICRLPVSIIEERSAARPRHKPREALAGQILGKLSAMARCSGFLARQAQCRPALTDTEKQPLRALTTTIGVDLRRFEDFLNEAL